MTGELQPVNCRYLLQQSRFHAECKTGEMERMVIWGYTDYIVFSFFLNRVIGIFAPFGECFRYVMICRKMR